MKDITDLLPGYNCAECGLRHCRDFTEALIKGDIELTRCPHMGNERYGYNVTKIKKILDNFEDYLKEPDVIKGVIDGLEADFTLAPLPDEPSCRENLYPFDPRAETEPGEYIRYRPLGCPITHFARILDMHKGI